MNWHLLTVLHAVPTLFLCGLIWFVQVVHYPLYRAVGHAQFVAYEVEHCRRVSWITLPMMLAELGLAGWLWWASPPAAAVWTGTGLALVAAVWASTFLLQVPCHDQLARGPNRAAMRRLVATNWLRTATWTLRGVIAVWLLVA